MAEPPTPPFRVIYSGTVLVQVNELSQVAAARGVAPLLADALRAVQNHLRTDPLGWGESSRTLRALGLTVAVGFHSRISVRFAVDLQRRLVYVLSMTLLPGNPFESLP